MLSPDPVTLSMPTLPAKANGPWYYGPDGEGRRLARLGCPGCGCVLSSSWTEAPAATLEPEPRDAYLRRVVAQRARALQEARAQLAVHTC